VTDPEPANTYTFQLDLATLCARLEQLKHDGVENVPWLLDRVLTCDLPRMEKYLNRDFSSHLAFILTEIVQKK
jgi:hypothetical protein